MTPSIQNDPYVPTPVETDRGGDLVVEDSSHISDRSHVVAPADRELYRLLLRVFQIDEAHSPDLLPAHLATHCDDLVDARDTLADIDRGGVILGANGPSYGMGYCLNARDAIDRWRDSDPLTLVAVGCSGSKHDVDGAVQAKNLYKGSYWSCKRDYGDEVSDAGQWRVLSAEHAILHPDQKIEHYERAPGDLKGVPVESDQRLPSGDAVETLLDRWALRVYDELQAWLLEAAGGVDPRDVELQVLVGRKYRDPLEDRGVFDALRAPADLEVRYPFQDVEQAQGGNGNQMGWMTDVVAEMEADPDDDPVAVTDGGYPDPDAFAIPEVQDIEDIRVALNLSQKELSRRAGLESGRWNDILRRDSDPQTSTIRALLAALQDAEPRTDDDVTRTGPKPQPSSLVDKLMKADPDDVLSDGGQTVVENPEPDLCRRCLGNGDRIVPVTARIPKCVECPHCDGTGTISEDHRGECADE